MGAITGISWTDSTWNPVTGCTRVSEGCRNCYIARTVPRQGQDPWTVVLHPERLYQPLKWKQPRRIFVNSLSDLFHEDVPDEFILECLTVMAIAKRHTFQVLTKRPDRMRKLLSKWGPEDIYLYWRNFSGAPREIDSWPLPNVWFGVSIENQETADERISLLLQTPAAVRFISAEPLLGPVDLSRWTECGCTSGGEHCLLCLSGGLNWVIAGGESGPGARPCDVAWIRSIKEQCKAAAVPCFVKQLGSYVCDRNDAGFDGDEPASWPMDSDVDDPDNEWDYQGARIRIRLTDRKGGDWNEWPEDLRVREFPR